jgi:hypothetical protein
MPKPSWFAIRLSLGSVSIHLSAPSPMAHLPVSIRATLTPGTMRARGFDGQYSDKLLVRVDGRTVYARRLSNARL